MKIKIKTPEEIVRMKKSGELLSQIMEEVIPKVVPGVNTLELDAYVDRRIQELGAKSSFKMEKGYHYATCMCVNDIVVHGIPTAYILKDNDILGIDAGLVFDGWHSDASWSVVVGNKKEKKLLDFLAAGEKALADGIDACRPGNHVGDISQALEDAITGGGYSPVKQLVGHGIGRELHEDPEVPCYLRGKIENTPELKEGMVLAVEAIYNMGSSPVVYGGDDGWTIVSRDGLPSGLFERTVAVTQNGPEILTPFRAFQG